MKESNGLWIPKEILQDANLKGNEKFFFAQIIALSQGRPCTASNAHFSKTFGVAKSNCTHIIKRLEKKGYIKIKLERDGKLVVLRKITVRKKGYCENINRGTVKTSIGYSENVNRVLSKHERENILDKTLEEKLPPQDSLLWEDIKKAVTASFEIHSTDGDNKHYKQIAIDVRGRIDNEKKKLGKVSATTNANCLQVINKLLTNWPNWAKAQSASYIRSHLTNLLDHVKANSKTTKKLYKKLNR